MIKIYSESTDESTNNVIDWLIYFKKRYHRINGDIEEFDYLHKPIKLVIDNEYKDEINSIWYRRPSRNTKHYSLKDDKQLYNLCLENVKSIVTDYAVQELKFINEYAFCNNINKKILGDYKNSIVNKYEVFEVAKKYGLSIPPMLITNSKKILSEFKSRHGELVIKTHNPITLDGKKPYKKYAVYTELFDDAMYNTLSNIFFPTCFQKKIEKQFEIRTFLLEKSVFSMAMFTQSNSQTSLDFRRYDRSNMNRRVPFRLPKEIEKKLLNLASYFHLNSGSIDIIKGVDGKFYFLEINPVGQFGMVAYPCNYYIHKKIAEIL